MGQKTITFCDGCKKTLEKVDDKYYLNLRTDSFWNGVDNDYFIEKLVFCKGCAINIKNTLIKIEKKLKKNKDE